MMSLLRNVIKKRPGSVLFKLARQVWVKANDTALNIETIAKPTSQKVEGEFDWDSENSSASLYRDPVPYESPDYWYVRKIRQMLFRDGDTNEVFFDLGAGKGRILCVMAQRPLQKVVGVELIPDLCDCAEVNASRMRGRSSPIEIICQDAATVDLSLGTTYFMFNPFGPETLRAVCENIRCSLVTNPRSIRIVYYNSVHEDVLQLGGWLSKYDTFETQSGLSVTFWKCEADSSESRIEQRGCLVG